MSVVMPKNKSKTIKGGTNVDLTTDSWIKKYETIPIKIKICLSQLIARIELKHWSLNQFTFDIIFLSKNISLTFETKISKFYG